MPGYSLHIGLNHCDPNAYPGWDSTLSGCINDANSMMQLASAAGFKTRRMIDAEATSNAVLAAIAGLGRTCKAGDIALISYSGHGGQVPDSTGEEPDGQDETWVLYDRQVCDDELNQMYSQFPAGVRILVVSDSCHSGTVARAVLNLATRHAVASNQVGKDMWPQGVVVEEAKPRAMPATYARADAQRRRGVYLLVQTLTRGAKNPDLAAQLILLSGCQDNQLSFDGNVNGAFTTALLQVWNQGRFTGSYRAFHSAILSKMPADQTPNFFTIGEVSSFEGQKPFSIDGAAGGGGSGSSGGGGTTTGTRPNLSEGSKGPDVVYLQQRLTVHGYTLGADGDFGPRTTSAVKAFQLSRGLTNDGKVGPVTWRALELSPSDAGTGGTWDDGAGTDDGSGGGTDDGGWGDDSGGGDSGGGTDDGGWGDDSGGGDSGGGTDDGGWGDDSGGDSGGGTDDGGWGDDSGGDSGGGTDDGGWGDDSGGDSGGGTDDGGWGDDSGGDSGGGTDDGGWGDDSGGGDSGGGTDDGGWGDDSGGDSGGGTDDGGWGDDSGGDSGGGTDDGGWGDDSGGGDSGGDGDDGGWGEDDRGARSGPRPSGRPVVRKGDRGEHVRYAQDCLRSLGYRGPVDGVYSARVESAVRSVQKSQSLPVTGVVDRRTWAALKQQHY